MAFTENLSLFFTADTPGYLTATIGGGTVGGFLDNGFASAFSGVVGGTDPVFTCMSSAIPNAAEGDAITINSVSYVLSSDPQHDGTGVAALQLRKAS